MKSVAVAVTVTSFVQMNPDKDPNFLQSLDNVVLHTTMHHIQGLDGVPRPCVGTLVVGLDAIEICYVTTRTFERYSKQMSFAHLAALLARYNDVMDDTYDDSVFDSAYVECLDLIVKALVVRKARMNAKTNEENEQPKVVVSDRLKFLLDTPSSPTDSTAANTDGKGKKAEEMTPHELIQEIYSRVRSKLAADRVRSRYEERVALVKENEVETILDTQHIISFQTKLNSWKMLSYVLYRGYKNMSSVEILCECTHPFMVEISIQRRVFGNQYRTYTCHIPQAHLRKNLLTQCKTTFQLDSDDQIGTLNEENDNAEGSGSGSGKGTVKGPYAFFESLLEDIYFDEERDVWYMKELELQELREYARSLPNVSEHLTQGDPSPPVDSATVNKEITHDKPPEIANKINPLGQTAFSSLNAYMREICEALAIKSSKRSSTSLAVIVEFLKNSRLSEVLSECSPNDLFQLALAADIMKLENTQIDIGIRGEVIEKIYIILDGEVVAGNESNEMQSKEQDHEVEKLEESNVRIVKRTYTTGEALGHKDLLYGNGTWTHDFFIIKKQENTTTILCSIPAEALLRYVGTCGEEPKEYLQCLWKFSKLFQAHTIERESANSVVPVFGDLSSMLATLEKESSNSWKQSEGERSSDIDGDNKEKEEKVEKEEDEEEEEEEDVEGLQKFKQEILLHRREVEHNYHNNMPPPLLSMEGLEQRRDKKMNFDATQGARIFVYQPGAEIFRQGDPRQFFYLVIEGECSFSHHFPEWLTKPPNKIIPKEVHIGQCLVAGDFSFLDGEKYSWIDKQRIKVAKLCPSAFASSFVVIPSSKKKTTKSSMDENESISMHSIMTPSSQHFPLVAHSRHTSSSTSKSSYSAVQDRKFFLFGEHKHSLIAMSRVELCVVPLESLAKSLSFFRDLLRLTNENYPRTLYDEEEIISAYHSAKQDHFERTALINQVFHEKSKLAQKGENFRVIIGRI